MHLETSTRNKRVLSVDGPTAFRTVTHRQNLEEECAKEKMARGLMRNGFMGALEWILNHDDGTQWKHFFTLGNGFVMNVFDDECFLSGNPSEYSKRLFHFSLVKDFARLIWKRNRPSARRFEHLERDVMNRNESTGLRFLSGKNGPLERC